MRHKKYTFKIGRTSAHRNSLIANQICSLVHSSKIITTIAKAKITRRIADKVVTLAKTNDLHHRRKIISILKSVVAVRILFNEIIPKFQNRDGGYTSIYHLNRRIGDGAEMCVLRWSFLND